MLRQAMGNGEPHRSPRPEVREERLPRGVTLLGAPRQLSPQ